MRIIENTISKESKIYMWVVALLPILSMYNSPVQLVDLGTFLGLPLILVCYYFARKKVYQPKLNSRCKRYMHTLTLIGIYMMMISLVGVCVGLNHVREVMSVGDRFVMLSRCIKLFSSVFIVLYCGLILMKFKHFMKIYGCIAKIAVGYIVLQTIFYYSFEFVLPPFISKFTKENYDYILNYNYHVQLGLFRPMGFFYEPAHFSEYVIPYLTYLLFRNKVMDKRSLFSALWITLGIVLSTSGIGCGMAMVAWIGTFFRALKYPYKNKEIILLFFVFCLLIPVFLKIPLFYKAIGRLFSFNNGSGAILGRMEPGYDIFADMSLLTKIFGIGYGNYPPGYAVSAPYSLISFGLLGTFIIICFLLKLIISTHGFPRVLSLVLLVMLFITMIWNTGFTLYLPCLIFSQNTNSKESANHYVKFGALNENKLSKCKC